jgi:PKD repeat protein
MKRYVTFSLLLVFGFLGLVGCSPQNQAPIAKFNIDPIYPKVNEEIDFNASASADPDNDKIISYKWDFGDGATGTGVFTTHTYKTKGDFIVKLVVTDARGASSTEASMTVSVTEGGLASCNLPEDKDEDLNGLAWDGQHLWVVQWFKDDEEYGKIFKLGTDCTVRGTLQAPGAMPGGVAWDGQNLWVSDVISDDNGEEVDKLLKIDPLNGNVVDSCSFKESGTGIITFKFLAWDGKYMWGSESEGDSKEVKKINVNGNICKITQSLALSTEGGIGGLAWDGQALWVADIGGKGAAKISRVNSANGKIEASYVAPGTLLQGLAWDSKTSSFWLLDSENYSKNSIIQFPLPK